MTTQSRTLRSSWARAVFENNAVKCEMPFIAARMQYRKPSLSLWIESLGRDCSQLVCRCLCAVFTVDVEQYVDWGLVGGSRADGADARQHLRQRGAQDCQSSRTDSRDIVCALLVQSRFQLLERLHVERLVQAFGQDRPDPRYSAKDIVRLN